MNDEIRSMIRNRNGVSVLLAKWIPEDELDSVLPRPISSEEYDQLFASSRVKDGLREFPVVLVGSVVWMIGGLE